LSLSFEYFVVKRFETVKAQKTALESMLHSNQAKTNAQEFNALLQKKHEQYKTLFESDLIKPLDEAQNNNNLYSCLSKMDFEIQNKAYKAMDVPDLSEPSFFEISTLHAVLEFLNTCTDEADVKKLWEIPKIDAALDYQNPKTKYHQFMSAGAQKKLDRCKQIKNTNPVYSPCFIMVCNHYGQNVGLLDFCPQTKDAIDKLIKLSARYAHQKFAKILAE